MNTSKIGLKLLQKPRILKIKNSRRRECEKAKRREGEKARGQESFQYSHNCILTIALLTSFLKGSCRRKEVHEWNETSRRQKVGFLVIDQRHYNVSNESIKARRREGEKGKNLFNIHIAAYLTLHFLLHFWREVAGKKKSKNEMKRHTDEK